MSDGNSVSSRARRTGTTTHRAAPQPIPATAVSGDAYAHHSTPCEACGKPAVDCCEVRNPRGEIFFIGHPRCADEARQLLDALKAAGSRTFRSMQAARDHLAGRTGEEGEAA